MYLNNTSRLNSVLGNRNETFDTNGKNSMLLCIAVLEIFITITGCIGNSLASIAVLRNKHLQVSANFYVLTLSVADLLVCGVLVPMRAAQHISIFKNKPFPRSAVNIIVFIGKATILISIATLGALSIDRLIAMKHPFLYRAKIRHSKTIVLVVSLVIWLASFSLPALSKIPGISNKDTLLIFVSFVVLMTTIIVVAYYNVYKIIKRQRVFRKRSGVMTRRWRRETFSSMVNATTNECDPTTRATKRNEKVPSEDLNQQNEQRDSDIKTYNLRDKDNVNISGKSGVNGKKRVVGEMSPLLKKMNNKRIKSKNANKTQLKASQNKENSSTLNDAENKYDIKSYVRTSRRKFGRQEITYRTKLVDGQQLGRRKSLRQIFSAPKSDSSFEKQRTLDRKISKMIALVIGSFMLLVFPRIILILYHVAAKETSTTKLLRLWSRVLIYMNSVLNPVLYAWRLREFRKEFGRFLIDCFRTITRRGVHDQVQHGNKMTKESSDQNS